MWLAARLVRSAFRPETVESYELGLKADWFDHRLRTNLAVYQADYDDLQTPFSGTPVGYPEVSIIAFTAVDGIQARGGSLTAALVMDGLSVGLSGAILNSHVNTTVAFFNPVMVTFLGD